MHPFVRQLLQAVSIWFMLSFLARTGLGWWLVAATTAFCAFIAAYVYLHVHRPSAAARLAAIPVVRPLVRGACALACIQAPVSEAAPSGPAIGPTPRRPRPHGATGRLSGAMPTAGRDDETPGDAATSAGAGSIALEQEEHFRRAARSLRQTVVGHDHVIEAIMHALARSVALRTMSESPDSTPLGRFLLAGPDGSGRRHLARAVGRCLFDSSDIVHIDVTGFASPEMAADAAWGIASGGEPGLLVSAVKSRPTRVIVIEHVDRLDARGVEQLAGTLASGRLEDPVNGTTVDFRSCVFFLLASGEIASIRPQAPKAGERPGPEGGPRTADGDARTHDPRVETAIEELASRTTLSRTLLQTLDGIHFCESLGPLDQAEVVAQLVERECARFGLRLAYVEPEFIVEQLRGIQPADGLASLPARVKAALKEPIYQATRRGATQLTLDQHTCSPATPTLHLTPETTP